MNCNITDSADVSDNTLFNIAQNKDGLIYGMHFGFGVQVNDTLFVFDPATKTTNIKCLMPMNHRLYSSINSSFDHNDNIVITGYDTITQTDHVYKFNINTCSFVMDYDMGRRLRWDGDFVFTSDYLYFTSECGIWQLNLNDTLPPVKVYNTSYSCDITMYEGYWSMWEVCYNDTTTFIVSNFEDPVTKLYRYNPRTGAREFMCQYNGMLYDGAYYNPPDEANFVFLGADTSVCPGFNIKLTTNNPGTVWSTGATGANISVTTPGKYWAKIFNTCGSYTDTINIMLQGGSQILDIGNDTSVCRGSAITIRSNSPNTIWKTGVTGSQVTVNPNADTLIVAKLPVVSCAVNDTLYDSLRITVNNNFPLEITASSTVYCNTPVTLSSNYANSSWSTGTVGAQIIINSGGKYWANYSNSCGVFSDTVTIQSFGQAVLNIGRDTFLCPGNTLTLFSNIPNVTWQDGTIASQISINSGGIYWAYFSDSCGVYRDSIIVVDYISPAPVNIGADTMVCQGSRIATYSNVSNVTWQDGSVGDSLVSIINSDITISAKKEDKCNSAGFTYDERIIAVYSDEVLEISADKASICEDTVELVSNITNTLWQFPDNSFKTGQLVLGDTAGWYIASHTGNCVTGKDSILIQKFCLEVCNVYVANTFTPNNDGLNDLFAPFFDCEDLEAYTFSVFNRWGERIFETTDKNKAWDGWYKNQPCLQDDYVFYIRVNDQNFKGIVTLLK